MRFLLQLILGAAAGFAQTNRTACDVTGSAAETLRTLPAMNDLSLSWDERMGPRRTLARKEPGNWPLQIALQDAILRLFHLGQEWDDAIAFYRGMEDRALGELLEARLISGLHRKRSREMLDRVAASSSDSPWPHLAMLEWAGDPMKGDRAIASTYFEQFRKLCPSSLRAFQYLDWVPDAGKMAGHLVDLRRLIDARKKQGLQAADVPLFRVAWKWEQVAAGEKGAAGFAAVVRSDLEAIRALSLYDNSEWTSVVKFGYEHALKDPAGSAAFEKEVVAKAPVSATAWWAAERAAPVPEPLDQLWERVKRFGFRPYNQFGLHRLMFDSRSPLTDTDIGNVADGLLSVTARYPDQGASYPPVTMMVAEAYARRKMRLDRVTPLVEDGLRQVELQEKHRRDADALSNLQGRIDQVVFAQKRARQILIRHAVASSQPERARVLLADYRRMLEQTKPADLSSREAQSWNYDQQMYLELGRLAGMDAQPVAELLPPKPEESQRFPVADFEATDLNGRTWRLSDLKGKVAYVNVWTTWCMPCRAEMPGLQKLHERWSGRDDRVVLTISADVAPQLARSFLAGQKYTFPVVHGRETAEKFFPPAYFPQNWLIDPQGRRLDMPAPRAFDTTLPQIEELAGRIAAPRP